MELCIFHSFPTRRSSDLEPPRPVIRDWHDLLGAEFGYDDRSEEHTSELQSHSDIVCRLLLEKKNITNVISSLMAVNIHITIIELNHLHTNSHNLCHELDA